MWVWIWRNQQHIKMYSVKNLCPQACFPSFVKSVFHALVLNRCPGVAMVTFWLSTKAANQAWLSAQARINKKKTVYYQSMLLQKTIPLMVLTLVFLLFLASVNWIG